MKNSLYYIIFGIIILISILLVTATASISIEKEYEFHIPEIDTSEDSHRSEYDFITLTLKNENTIFPKRVEIKPVYLCAYQVSNNELLHSTQLNTNRRGESISSEIFDLNEKFIDVSPNSQINIIYSAYVSKYDLQKAEEVDYQYRVEYRELKSNINSLYRYGLSDDVCRGEVEYNTIFPEN